MNTFVFRNRKTWEVITLEGMSQQFSALLAAQDQWPKAATVHHDHHESYIVLDITGLRLGYIDVIATLGPMATIANKALVDAFAAVYTAADQRAAAEYARTLAVKFHEAVDLDKDDRHRPELDL